MHILAITYFKQRRWQQAEALVVQTLEAQKKLLGEEHLDALKSMETLAHIIKKQDRDEEAIQFLSATAKLYERVLGLEHQYTQEAYTKLKAWHEETRS